MRLFVSRIVLRTDRIEGGSSHLKWTAWIELARSGVFDSVLMCWLFQVESIAATWLRAQPDLIWPANLGESQRISANFWLRFGSVRSGVRQRASTARYLLNLKGGGEGGGRGGKVKLWNGSGRRDRNSGNGNGGRSIPAGIDEGSDAFEPPPLLSSVMNGTRNRNWVQSTKRPVEKRTAVVICVLSFCFNFNHVLFLSWNPIFIFF